MLKNAALFITLIIPVVVHAMNQAPVDSNSIEQQAHKRQKYETTITSHNTNRVLQLLNDPIFVVKYPLNGIADLLRSLPKEEVVRYVQDIVDEMTYQAMVNSKPDGSELLLQAFEQMVPPHESDPVIKGCNDFAQLIKPYRMLVARMSSYNMHDAAIQECCAENKQCVVQYVHEKSDFISKIRGTKCTEAFVDLFFQMPHVQCAVNGRSIIHVLAASGNVEFMRRVLKNDKEKAYAIIDAEGKVCERSKIDVNRPDIYGWTALHHAVNSCDIYDKIQPNLEMVKLLLENEAAHLIQNKLQLTPLGELLVTRWHAIGDFDDVTNKIDKCKVIINYLLTLKDADKDLTAQNCMQRFIENSQGQGTTASLLEGEYPLFAEYYPNFFDQYIPSYSESSSENSDQEASSYSEENKDC